MHLVFDIRTIAELEVQKGQGNTYDTFPPLFFFKYTTGQSLSRTS